MLTSLSQGNNPFPVIPVEIFTKFLAHVYSNTVVEFRSQAFTYSHSHDNAIRYLSILPQSNFVILYFVSTMIPMKNFYFSSLSSDKSLSCTAGWPHILHQILNLKSGKSFKLIVTLTKSRTALVYCFI